MFNHPLLPVPITNTTGRLETVLCPMAQRWWSGQVVKGCISSLSSSFSSFSMLSIARALLPLGSAPTMTLLFSPYRASMSAPPPGMALAMYFPTVCSSTSNSGCQTLSCPICDPSHTPTECYGILSSRIVL